MRRWNRIAILVCAVLVADGFRGHAAAQSPPAGDEGRAVRAWFDRAWRAAQEFPSFEAVSFAWRAEDFDSPPAGRLEALRREVARHPEHPERVNLPRYLRHAAGVPTVHRHVLYSIGEARWRYNTTSEDGGFSDAAIGPSEAWRLTGTTLMKTSRAEALGDDPDQAVILHEREFVSPVGMLVHGYLSAGRTAGLTPGEVSVSGSRWVVRLGSSGDRDADRSIVLEVSGRWDTAAGRGFVEQVTIAANGYKPESVGTRWRFHDWVAERVPGSFVASRVDEYRPDGSRVRSLVFEGCGALPAGGFEAVVAAPFLPGTDAVRGTVEIRVVGDYRSGQIREYEGGSEVASYAMEEGQWSERRAFRDRLRWAGWLMIAAVGAAGFVVVRARGSQGTKPAATAPRG